MTVIPPDEMERRRRERIRKLLVGEGNVSRHDAAISVEDFYAYMPAHKYIFVPTLDLWPASSVNARIPPIDPTIGQPAADPIQGIAASAWLDRNRAVEQMTWAPGEPTVMVNRIVAEGGFVERQGSKIFNLYRPPVCAPGTSSEAHRWIEHVRRVYPDDAEHIFNWLAHRVQRPGEKINHALLLGGAPGIGKDTILLPVIYAVGSWNFQEVSPTQILGRFNGFVRTVILRVSEARDLGEISSYALYEHLKPFLASPPETLRVDEKNLREFRIPNLMGAIITSNYLTDGIHLPPDDRRHYVAWSPLPAAGEPGALDSYYFDALYQWYQAGGLRHVAAWLVERDLSSFDPKAPPRKTRAFWEIVDAQRGSGESELNDVIDGMTAKNSGNRPVVFSTDTLVANSSDQLQIWLRDPKYRRQIPKRLERIGYVRVQNPDAEDRLWKINGRRQAVYGDRNIPEKLRIDETRELVR